MRRLRDGEGPLAKLLSAASPLPPATGRAQLKQRPFGRRTGPPVLVPLAVTLAASLLLVWLIRPGVPAGPSAVRAGVPATAEVSLQPGAVAHRTAGSLDLASGTVEVNTRSRYDLVTPRGRVECEQARLRVTVAADSSTVFLFVEEGSAVVRSPQGVFRVGARDHWSSSPALADELLHREALALEREGHTGRALLLLESLRPRSSAFGELALYDQARILIGEGDLGRARETLDEHDRRFPGGALGMEVASLRLRLTP